MEQIFSIFSLSISIFFSILIIYYLKRLDTIKCNCSLNFKRNYILGFTSLSLLLTMSNLLFRNYKIFVNLMLIMYIPWVIASITNVIFTIKYISELKKNKCECSESVYREIMFILAIMNALVMGLSFFIILFVLIQIPELRSLKLYKKSYNKMIKTKI
jgi:hypothetical protein